jgi:magnesium transporter
MKSLESLFRRFAEEHPRDAAQALDDLDVQEAAKILNKLPTRLNGLLMERLVPSKVAPLLDLVDSSRATELLASLPPRQASLIIQYLEADKREALLSTLSDSMGSQLRELIEYPLDTAGGMMEPRVTSIYSDHNVQAAVNALRRAPRQTLYYLYVTDREGRLTGVLNMRSLLLASPRDSIESLMSRQILRLPVNMSREDVLTLLRRHRFLALPVVDDENRLIGVIKHDEALLASQIEAFENIQKMVGAGEDERALSPVSTVIKRRLPWLYVNLVTAFAAAAVVGIFEGVIRKVTALAVLLPIVSGQGGNTGAQALAVVMRGLALREILPGAAKRVIMKEVLGGLLNGIAVAVVTAAAVWAWSRSFWLSVVIGLAMVVNMAVAGLSGAAIPLILRALRRDPAQSASIFLTTATDVVGFAAFLGFAAIFMPLLIG